MTGAVTEKAPASLPVPPFGFVTVRSRAPIAAPAATVRVAVIWLAETKETFDAVTPIRLRLTVDPATNPVPLIVTGIVAPGAACLSTAHVPATCGVAIEVPLAVP